MVSLLFSLFVVTAVSDTTEEFQYYYGELVTQQLPDGDGMLFLIADRLAESVFWGTSKSQFEESVRLLAEAPEIRPDLNRIFERIDRRLQTEFQARLERAKKRRWIYSAAGALVGAVVGFPIGKSLSGKFGSAAIWIAIPTGALAGGGAGFLLGHLIEMPDFSYHPGLINPDSDIDAALDEVDTLMDY